MARPTKQGIDYFPLDVQLDDKTELFIADSGAEGLGVLITIWQLIYQNNGYYVTNGEDLRLLVRRRVMSDVTTIESIIDSAIRRGVFDIGMHDKHKILTSKAIQKRFFDAAKKKKTVSVVENYIMNGVSVGINAVYSVGNATNVDVKEEVNVDVKEEVEVEEETTKPLAPIKKKKPPKEKPQTGPTWEAYTNAYLQRYRVEPLRNITVNSQMAKFCKQVSLEEAPHIAASYVAHNDQFYVKQSHPVGLLLKDCQKLRTEWITGRQVTSGVARQVDNSQTNQSAAQEAIRIMRERGDNA